MTAQSTKGRNALRCVVATTAEHVRDSMILRSICFVNELGISPSFIFDGNDHQATHFVFYDGDDPIGSLRVRWFAGFAKYERTCFRENYRQPFTIKRCIQMTFEHAARKGYTRVMTQSEPRLTKLWTKLFKFDVLEKPPVWIEGHPEPYMTVVGTIPASDHAIDMESDGSLLLKVEGEWDGPQSAGASR